MGVKLELRVHPGSNRNQVTVEGARAEVWTKARAENNKANLAILKLIAKHFNKPTTAVHLVSGATSRKKIVIID
ncbi:MAG: DUF167 domain-containing protein [Candidatus Altiarchaeota archaeon]|nr:DUF167 domain-containing protein [Candidatus Altiarchaeota archaeon]